MTGTPHKNESARRRPNTRSASSEQHGSEIPANVLESLATISSHILSIQDRARNIPERDDNDAEVSAEDLSDDGDIPSTLPPTTPRNLSSAGQNVASASRTNTSVNRAVPSTSHAVPSTSRASPSTSRAVPSTSRNISSTTQDSSSASSRIQPTTEDLLVQLLAATSIGNHACRGCCEGHRNYSRGEERENNHSGEGQERLYHNVDALPPATSRYNPVSIYTPASSSAVPPPPYTTASQAIGPVVRNRRWYVVTSGLQVGVFYESWDVVARLVLNIRGSVYWRASNRAEAEMHFARALEDDRVHVLEH